MNRGRGTRDDYHVRPNRGREDRIEGQRPYNTRGNDMGAGPRGGFRGGRGMRHHDDIED